ncbi:hypothetical protein I203_102407 [Kwoniella mangroviensis CBS 8507]|uniref:uncharacterized protein n=1 Tax=Kwoniella mangroviensis CBS 8507 TaxID=1296122 RepID=UPI00080D683C|nr:uncharacterized protein I203_06528 [Kwoniella mangroviensis CBS 8507]OCF64347.1 hypothetical protein I203_06528 [Kwoniella mangroviensis CBS 8507]
MSSTHTTESSSIDSDKWYNDTSLVIRSKGPYEGVDYTLSQDAKFSLRDGQTTDDGKKTLPKGTKFSIYVSRNTQGQSQIYGDIGGYWGATTAPGGPSGIPGYNVTEVARPSPYNLKYLGDA